MRPSDYNLIEKYLDGSATPEEFAVLEDRLRADPATRLCLLQEAGIESQLRLLLQGSAAQSTALTEEEALAEMESGEVSQPSVRRTIYRKSIWLWIPLAAAALLLVLGLPLFLKRNQHPIANAGIVQTGVITQQQAVAASGAQQVDDKHVVVSGEPANKELAVLAQPPKAPSISVTVPDKPAIPPVKTPLDSTPEVHMAAVKPEPSPMAPSATAQAHVDLPEKPVLPVPALPRRDDSVPMIAMAQPVLPSSVNSQPNSAAATDATTPPAAAAVKPAAVAVVVASSPLGGRIASIGGSVYLTRLVSGGASRRLIQQMGEVIMSDDVIETGPSSSTVLRYEDGTLIRLYARTQVTLRQAGGTRNLQVGSGAVDLRVQPLGQGSNLVVRTAHVEVRVVGTEFRVITDSTGSWVGVKAGQVEVVRMRANGEVVLLEPGYFASAARGSAPVSTEDATWRGKCQVFTGSSKYP
ncbi:MAG: FecR domain-containing protein [Magnetococcus sp. WYHC-3]